MKIEVEIGAQGSVNRTAVVSIAREEIRNVAFNIAFGAERNRTGLYMRRHSKIDDLEAGLSVGPNNPLRSPEEPKKLTLAQHIGELGLRCLGEYSGDVLGGGEKFRTQPAMIAISVTDVVANLMRPCFSMAGIGKKRIFCFEDEPTDARRYWAMCCFVGADSVPNLTLMDVQFNLEHDSVFSVDGRNLAEQGLEWAVSLVPLVKDSTAVSALEIAENNYDLRQILGRDEIGAITEAYEGWYSEWVPRVRHLVQKHIDQGLPFEVFYHSILALDHSGSVRIYQLDGALPELASRLASQGIVAAGLLDSGGSCALYDPWIGGYLNHGWYFREPRGAALVFELKAQERLPEPRWNSWYQPVAAEGTSCEDISTRG